MKYQKAKSEFIYERKTITIKSHYTSIFEFEFSSDLGFYTGSPTDDLFCEMMLSSQPHTFNAQLDLLSQPRYLPFAKKLVSEILLNHLPNNYKKSIEEKTHTIWSFGDESLNHTYLESHKIPIVLQDGEVLYHLKTLIQILQLSKQYKAKRHLLTVFPKKYLITHDGYAHKNTIEVLIAHLTHQDVFSKVKTMIEETEAARMPRKVTKTERTTKFYYDPTLLYLKPFVAFNFKALKVLDDYMQEYICH